MAIVAPFQGPTCDSRNRPDFTHRVAPPCNCISVEAQEAVYQIDPHPVTRLIPDTKNIGDRALRGCC